jgi:HSP20 family molecular chaperone IbpA
LERQKLCRFWKHFTSVNVKENQQNYDIELAVPGMKKEDFKISLDRNILTISSEQKSETEEKNENGKYTRREFNYNAFSRSFIAFTSGRCRKHWQIMQTEF